MRILSFCILFFYVTATAQTLYFGTEPGKAVAFHKNKTLSLENHTVQLIFQIQNKQLLPVLFKDKANSQTIDLLTSHWFELTLASGAVLTNNDFVLEKGPSIQSLRFNKHAARYAEQLNGKLISAILIHPASGLNVLWEARLSDGANYIQQRWYFRTRDSLEIVKYAMLQVPGSGVMQQGSVDGSPLILKNLFFALEHPMSKSDVRETEATAYLPVQHALTSSSPMLITTVMGATPPQQLRRGFLYYLERERAHPFRPFLHYNSWYDLSWVDRKMEDSSSLDRIRIYGDSLITKRGISLKAFLFDDGWDNDSTLWEVSRRYPKGFSNVQQLAARYGAQLGVWLSPWGGYDPSQSRRLKYGRMQNPPFETNANGFSLAGPVYFNRFRDVTTHFMQKNGVGIFKFDGVGAGNGASGAGLNYQKDIEALLRLTQALRVVNPDVYLSLTVGTWPSPYWLYYGDAIWRAGSDFGMTGSGSNRQKWITYRDAESYKNVVLRSPLFPLNSVMLHGINIANVGYPQKLEMEAQSIQDEIWAFFASGTSLQELYINPHLLNTAMWDCLAAAARWSQNNARVLLDAHWVGGDPAKGEVYGYASWSPGKGIFSLRNPSAQSQTFILDIERIFELPSSAPAVYTLQEVIKPGNAPGEKVQKGSSLAITLEPYQLKIWEAVPGK